MQSVKYKYSIHRLLDDITDKFDRMRSKEALQEKLGISHSRFYKIINALDGNQSTNMTITQLQIVADHFNVSMEEVCIPCAKKAA